MVEQSRQNHVHALDVPHLCILVGIAFQNVLHPFLEDLVLEGRRVALRPGDVLHYLH